MSASDSSNSAASRRKKREKTSLSDVFSSQELKHIKSLRRPISSNSVIKVSSSSSSISSLTTSKTSVTTATTTTTNVGSPSGTSGRSTGAGMPEFPLEFYLRRNYPWHSVYVPQNVDKSIEEVFIRFLNLVIFNKLYD